MSGTTGRFAQAAAEVVHDALPASTGTAPFCHVGVEVLRDNADIAATTGRFGQAAVEIVHDALPASGGRARFGQVAVEVVRSVAEIAVSGVGGGQVMVICTWRPKPR